MKKLLIPAVAIVLLAGGGWYYYTTTVDYAFAGIKKACLAQDMKSFAKSGVAHINGTTRELTDTEITMMSQGFSNTGNQECPFKSKLDKKVVKSKLTDTELSRLGVKEGWSYTFDGDSSSLKIIRYNGQWRPLVADVSLNTSSPQLNPGAQTMPQYQLEHNSQTQTAPPTYSVPRP